MKCQKCGSFIRDDSKFCNYCGQKVNIRPQRTENPGVSTRPRDEDFDVAVTKNKAADAEEANNGPQRAGVIVALLAAGAVIAVISVLFYNNLKSHQHVVVSIVESEIETPERGSETPTEAESVTEAPSSEEAPSETEMPTEPLTEADWHFFDTENATYQIFEDHAVLIAFRTAEPVLVLPDYAEGQPITIIADNTFKDNHSIRFVQLPRYLESLNRFSFANCWELREVVTPDTLKAVSGDAFENSGDFRIISHKDTLGERLAEQLDKEWQEGDSLTVPVEEPSEQ